MHYVYIIECSDGTLYTGWTTDMKKRLASHEQGRGAKRTRGRGPFNLVYLESFQEKGDALRREIAIKKMSRIKKLALIDANGRPFLPDD